MSMQEIVILWIEIVYSDGKYLKKKNNKNQQLNKLNLFKIRKTKAVHNVIIPHRQYKNK